jgi:hypothetical protein
VSSRRSAPTLQERGGIRAGLRAATLLAGAAEGVVPRRFLAMLLPTFRN